MTRGNLSWICFKFFVGKEWVVLHKKFVQKCVFIYHILSYTDPIFETSLEKQLIKKCSPNAMHILVFFSAKRDNSIINGKWSGVFKGKKISLQKDLDPINDTVLFEMKVIHCTKLQATFVPGKIYFLVLHFSMANKLV